MSEATSIAIEVRRRLKRRADELGLELEQAVLYYAIERFLYRLSQTGWSDRLIVKGAVMLRVWDAAVARPTRDIDFLGRIPNTPDAVRGVVMECLSVAAEDGIVFRQDVGAEPITVRNRYPGVRVRIAGDLAGARFVLRLDVGIDDAVVPDPSWVHYPAMLGDSEPVILAYRPATAVAEKFQAMIEIGLSNSRLKDYHDIWMLSQTLEFGGRDLSAALRATFDKRGTALPTERPAELTADYAGQLTVMRMWSAYRGGLSNAGVTVPEELEQVVDEIAEFIVPAANAAASGAELDSRWVPGQGWA